ncbi:hypothetical protein B0F90DRAFT_1785912 [Multifurca ochricompacta]|uniref:Uncharacterized protein n=1 Tax=Multifurca ochricompacta TaxID=376703 RepID=A0AAD4QJ03_9AGAM|nr:hypothetical protein B0F90DRAFT_1785912 [Multifurca ochricompacta]
MRLAILTALQFLLSVTRNISRIKKRLLIKLDISKVLSPTSHVLKPHNFPHPDTKTPRYSTQNVLLMCFLGFTHHACTSTSASTLRREPRSTLAGMLALICLFSAGCTAGTASTKAARERAMIDLMNCIVFATDRVGSDG